MITPDDNGQLPLHKALQNNASLGSNQVVGERQSICAIRTVEANFAMSLHIAWCEHQDSTNVVQHLLDADTRTLKAVDCDKNTALHCACCGAKYDTIALLLEKVWCRISLGKLWDSNEVSERESLEYTERVFRLIKEYPEVVKISD